MINKRENYIYKWYGKILHIFNPIYHINYYYISTPTFNEFRKIMKKKFKIELEEDNNKEGFFIVITNVLRNTNVGMIWTKGRSDIGVLAHECFHALYWTAKNRGLNQLAPESEEAFAYMLAFLVETISKAK